jgi:exosome complex component RRP45
MPREIGPSLNERQFFQKALQENLRIDGRAFDQFRALELDFGDEYGVADVRLGKTRYVLLPPTSTRMQNRKRGKRGH